MADFNASLPIRTENAGDVQMKLVDGENTARVLKIEEDGSINANVVTGEIDVRDLAFATDKVDVSGSEVSLAEGQSVDIGNFPSAFEVSNFPSSFEISNLPATQAVSATDLDIRALAYADDSVTAHLAEGSSLEVSNFPASFEVSNLPTSIEVSNFPASFEISNLGSITDLDIRDLSYSSDSVTAHLAEGSQIEISNASLTVQATDLDMRDLAFESDKVDVSGSEVSLAAGQQIELTNASLTIEASDLDIRDLAFNTDKVDVSGSSVTVSATALDIRPLSAMAGDNVAAMLTDGTHNLQIAEDGTMPVSATAFDIRGLSYSQDTIQVTDGTGQPINIGYNGGLRVLVEERYSLEYSYEAYSAVSANGNATSSPFSLPQLGFARGLRVAASGKAKVEFQVEATPGEEDYMTIAVAYNSAANPNIDLDLGDIRMQQGQGMRIVVHNREGEAMDIHSTLLYGYDLAQ